MRLKHTFMTLIWRIQQSQALIAPIFYAATLTGVFWPVVREYLYRRGWPPSQVLPALLMIFAATFLLITLMGVVYDRVLKLWREQVDVGVERNPYQREKLAPKEIVLWKRMHLRTLQQVAHEDPKAASDVRFMERWIEKSLADPRIREQVEALERWIEEPAAAPLPAGPEPSVPGKAAPKDPH